MNPFKSMPLWGYKSIAFYISFLAFGLLSVLSWAQLSVFATVKSAVALSLATFIIGLSALRQLANSPEKDKRT